MTDTKCKQCLCNRCAVSDHCPAFGTNIEAVCAVWTCEVEPVGKCNLFEPEEPVEEKTSLFGFVRGRIRRFIEDYRRRQKQKTQRERWAAYFKSGGTIR